MTSATLKWPLAAAARSNTAMRLLTIACWCTIVLGIALRFVQLPTRVLYIDEAITQLRVAGHTDAETIATLYDGRPRSVAQLRRMATVDASASPQRLIASLEQEDAQHPPLFYLLELAVVRLFGNALAVWRVLPALFGVLALPAAYALARAMSADRNAALLTAALFAVSPIERIYSDQAREYSLLTLLVLIATLAVFRAVRAGGAVRWATYGAIVTAGCYTSPFMLYAVAGHLVFVLATSWRAGRVRVVGFAAAVALALVAYAPWIVQLAIHRNDISATNVWSATKWPLARLAAKWAFNTGATVFDLEYLDLRWAAVFAFVALAIAFAIYRAFRSTDSVVRWCLGSAIVVPALLLMLPDVLLGEHRSSVARYGLPAFAMLVVLVARGLAGRPIIASAVLAAGLLSSVVGAQHASWWDNDANADDAQIAAIVNGEPHAQLLSTIAPPGFITYARLLNPDVTVRLSPALNAPDAGEPLFVLDPGTNGLATLTAHTGRRFVRITFRRTVTARDIGSHIGKAAAPRDATSETTELFEAVPPRNAPR